MADPDPRPPVLTRRQALVAAGAGVAALAGGLGWWRPWENEAERGRVAVVGAGLAGLTAAYELDRAGFEVVVLEARDRVGGRVRTLREPLQEGQHAELGGEFIDRVHRAIRSYASRFGLPLEDATAGFGDLANGLYLRSQGRVRVASSLYGPGDRRQVNRFWRAVRELGRTVRVRDPLGRAAALDRRSVRDLLDELGTDGLARVQLDAYVRDEYGVEPAEASLLGFLRLERIYASVPEADVEAHRIEGGNDRLTEAFAERLGDSILLRRAATEVADEGNRVRVRTDGEEWTADRAVLAAPLPALRGIEFVPPLPRALAGAVAELQYGRVSKVVLQFADRFWRERGFSGDVISDVPELRTWEASDQQPGAEGILIDYLAGRGNDAVARLDPAARSGIAAGAIAAGFPNSPEPIAAGSAAWQRERYSGGCWASPAPGQVTRFWDALRGTRGRLHLAGEHTDPIFGSYMEGAVRSGRRVAAEIIERG